MRKRVAVILAGCGYLDGAEIREAVLALYHLDLEGAEVKCFAPDIDQHHTVNHFTGKEENETRNVLAEAARIARSEINDIRELRANEFDALVLPGGYGVAKNLSDLAFKGADAKVQAGYEFVIKQFHVNKKPIGAICIAPAVVVAALRKGVVTIGDDEGVAEAIRHMGGTHRHRSTTEIVVDEDNKLVTTSAYMRDDTISRVGEGIAKLVKKVLELS